MHCYRSTTNSTDATVKCCLHIDESKFNNCNRITLTWDTVWILFLLRHFVHHILSLTNDSFSMQDFLKIV